MSVSSKLGLDADVHTLIGGSEPEVADALLNLLAFAVMETGPVHDAVMSGLIHDVFAQSTAAHDERKRQIAAKQKAFSKQLR